MYRSFYEDMSLTALPLFTLFLFLAVFLGVVFWAYAAKRRPQMDSLAALPLEDRDE